MAFFARQSYADRLNHFTNPAAQQLLRTIVAKQTNLCVSIDVATSAELLLIARAVAPYVCLIKTHIDILLDFTPSLVQQLTTICNEQNVVLFEDRKFADIGNTVSMQYDAGVYKIASWAHITNAHIIPGPGVIQGLAKVGKPLGRACLLLAEMSSKGNFCDEAYRHNNVKLAIEGIESEQNDTEDFVVGFIAMSRVDDAYYQSRDAAAAQPGKIKDMLVLTPGVHLESSGDGMGQQYRTPEQVISESLCDVIIVGRGIYAPLLQLPKGGAATEQQTKEAISKVAEMAHKYKQAGWEAYEKRIATQNSAVTWSSHSDSTSLQPATHAVSTRPSRKRKLFEPAAPSVVSTELAPTSAVAPATPRRVSLAAATVTPTNRYSTRASSSASSSVTKILRTPVEAEEADSSLSEAEGGEGEVDPKIGSGGSGSKKKGNSKQASYFEISPRKKQKAIKLELDPSEVKAAPKRWQEQYETLMKQRKRIIAPVDTMGCQENGKEEFRADAAMGRDDDEDDERKGRRERFTTLISLMLSSQTKDPVTAQAVKNLQTTLPNGLCVESLRMAGDAEIQECIKQVGFWRRKTGYIKSAAHLIYNDFEGDVPRDLNDLCSIPGVGPKMAYLMLAAMDINLGIGVDVHVHRLSNRLGWCKTTEPEDTRLRLQSFLPRELWQTINKALVGFGQIVCVPVSPRCDLCDLARDKLCPSRRKVDPKSIANRVQVHLLDEEDEDLKSTPQLEVKLEVEGGPDGDGAMLATKAEVDNAVAIVKKENGSVDW